MEYVVSPRLPNFFSCLKSIQNPEGFFQDEETMSILQESRRMMGRKKLEKFLTRSMHQAALIRLIFCVELIPVSIMFHFSSLEISLGYYYFVLFMLKI